MDIGKILIHAAPIAIALLFNTVPASFAVNPKLDREIKAYNQRDYRQTINLGREALREDPENPIARYYLANAYCQLRDFENAVHEYTLCTTLEKSPQVVAYAQLALSTLDQFNNNQGESQTEPSTASNTEQVDPQVATLREKLLKEEQEELDKAQANADKLADKIRQRANEEVSSVPQYLQSSPSSYQVENSSFAGDVADVRQREEARIKDIYDQLPKIQAQIKQTYEQKIYGVSSPAKSFNNGSSKLNSAGSDLYVRNYSQTDLPRPQIMVRTQAVAPGYTVPTM